MKRLFLFIKIIHKYKSLIKLKIYLSILFFFPQKYYIFLYLQRFYRKLEWPWSQIARGHHKRKTTNWLLKRRTKKIQIFQKRRWGEFQNLWTGGWVSKRRKNNFFERSKLN